MERFWSRVAPIRSGCWIWDGCHARGYSKFYRFRAKQVQAHRFGYELVRGPIPSGLTLDHLCRNRGCVNPWHLDPVSHHENVMRGLSVPALNAAKTHCKRGHEFTPDNTYWTPDGRRNCATCRRGYWQERQLDPERRQRHAEHQRRYLERKAVAA